MLPRARIPRAGADLHGDLPVADGGVATAVGDADVGVFDRDIIQVKEQTRAALRRATAYTAAQPSVPTVVPLATRDGR